MSELTEPFYFEVRYKKVRIPPWVADAVEYTAKALQVPKQALYESILAQVVLHLRPELAGRERLHVSAALPGMPTIAPPPAKVAPLSDEGFREGLAKPRVTRLPIDEEPSL